MIRLVKGTTIDDKPLFVISDLHLGNGSARDVFERHNKKDLLHRFLDSVDHQGGVLLILGDLLECWRFDLADIVATWERLLSRLYAMNARIVPGNHDAVLNEEQWRSLHPFFQNTTGPFTHQCGDKRFRFMHGHEIDPFVPAWLERWGQALVGGLGALEFAGIADLCRCDGVVDVLLERGEQLLHAWYRLTRRVLHDELRLLSPEQVNQLQRSIRTRHMLSRFCQQRDIGCYDIIVTGHTRQAGCFNDWYYNSGSWTRPVNSFVKIGPDGHVEVFDWDEQGLRQNDNIIGNRSLAPDGLKRHH